MLLTVGLALDLMFLTPFVAIFCLQIIKPRMYFNLIQSGGKVVYSVSTLQQIFLSL